jgi:toxin ParE1/3/4
MRRLVAGPGVGHDLDEIWAFVAEESPQSAERLIREIGRAFQRLQEMPDIGHRHPSVRRTDLLCWPVRGTWLLFYRFDDDVVEIARVVFGGRELRGFDR